MGEGARAQSALSPRGFVLRRYAKPGQGSRRRLWIATIGSQNLNWGCSWGTPDQLAALQSSGMTQIRENRHYSEQKDHAE